MGKGSGARGRTFASGDHRAMPVSVIRHEDAARIAEMFDGRKLPVARSVYFAVVQLASESGGDRGESTRKDLAALAGVSVRTLDEFVAALVDGRLLHVERRREDGLNLPNVYVLGSPNEGGAADSTTLGCCASAADSTQQSSTDHASADGEKKNDGCGLTALLPAGVEVGADLLADAESLLTRKTKVDGKIVQAEEMAKALVAIATFNACSGSDFGIGAHLRAVVMRIRERESMSAEKHQRLVQSAWRLKWWERSGRGRRATPAVVYGNERVFEQVVLDAVDEAAGRKPEEGVSGPRKRFTRED